MRRIVAREPVSLADVADALALPPAEIVERAFSVLGLMLTVDQVLERPEVDALATELGATVVWVGRGSSDPS